MASWGIFHSGCLPFYTLVNVIYLTSAPWIYKRKDRLGFELFGKTHKIAHTTRNPSWVRHHHHHLRPPLYHREPPPDHHCVRRKVAERHQNENQEHLCVRLPLLTIPVSFIFPNNRRNHPCRRPQSREPPLRRRSCCRRSRLPQTKSDTSPCSGHLHDQTPSISLVHSSPESRHRRKIPPQPPIGLTTLPRRPPLDFPSIKHVAFVSPMTSDQPGEYCSEIGRRRPSISPGKTAVADARQLLYELLDRGSSSTPMPSRVPDKS